nr:xylulose kinase-1 [Tanacetum cinerariifolium]
MSSLFADTHNMVAILVKSDAAKGFEQIMDFLSGSYIHYALTVNPHIYVSCIKQFWNTASVKCSDGVTRLQALVDKKMIMISEDVIREILQLDDAEGMVCFPNEEIFASLAQIGYEKPKGFLGVETPLFEGTLAAREIAEEGIAEEQVQADDAVATAVQETSAEDVANKVIPSTPTLLILPSPPSQQPQSEQIESSDDMEDVFNQGRMIDDLDKDKGIELVVDQVKDADTTKTEGRHVAEQAKKQAEIYHLDLDHPSKVLSMQEDDSKVQEVVKVVTTAKLITEVVTAATSQASAASATISAAKPSIPAAALTVVATYTRRRKGVIIRDSEEELSSKSPSETP